MAVMVFAVAEATLLGWAALVSAAGTLGMYITSAVRGRRQDSDAAVGALRDDAREDFTAVLDGFKNLLNESERQWAQRFSTSEQHCAERMESLERRVQACEDEKAQIKRLLNGS